ncbi:hypothetical protein V491_05850 [Pseudogymnoascus sp. VKM F-3775]|nr:hypothetical protein V491_05850 [Pseudogymnoascus sp. VKM F-3775]
MVALEPGVGTAMSQESHGSSRSAQAAKSGREEKQDSPGNFSQGMDLPRRDLDEEAWHGMEPSRRRLDLLAHDAFLKIKKQVT